MKKYPISFWCGPPHDKAREEEVIKEIAEAGMTVMEARYDAKTNKRVIELAAKYGMKTSVLDDRIYAALNGEDGWEAQLESFVNDYKDLPTVDNYFLQDEPTEVAFPALRRVKDKLSQLDPAHKALVNLLPIPPVVDVEHYELYLREFVNVFEPEILSYDHYNLMYREVERLTDQPEANLSEENRTTNGWVGKLYEKYNRPTFLDNLELVRQVAQEKKIPWKIIVLCVEHWVYRNVNESEIRWQVFNSLAYGPMEIDYFTYWTPAGNAEGWDYHNAIINLGGTKNSRYYIVQRVNKDLALLGAEIVDAQSEEVLHIGFEPGDKLVRYFTGYKALTQVDARALTLGFFDNGRILLANKDMENSQSVSFTFDGQPEHLNKNSGKWEQMSLADDGRYHLCIAAGDGEMIR